MKRRTKLAFLLPEQTPRPIPRTTQNESPVGAECHPRDRQRMPSERGQDLLPRRGVVQPDDGMFGRGGFTGRSDHFPRRRSRDGHELRIA